MVVINKYMSEQKVYSVEQAKAQGRGIEDFNQALIEFGVPCFKSRENGEDSTPVWDEFVELIYNLVNPKKVTLVKRGVTKGAADTYSLYGDDVLLARFRDGKLVRLCVPGVKKINGNNYFLMTTGVQYVTHASFPDLEVAGEDFMAEAHDLKIMCMPKLKQGGENFAYYTDSLEYVVAPKVKSFGNRSFFRTENLKLFCVPELTNPGEYCLCNNDAMTSISLPNVKKLPKYFMYAETRLEKADAPKLKDVGINCADIFYDIMFANRAHKRK